MRVGIIGPSTSVATVLAEAARADLPLECIPLIYHDYCEAVEILQVPRGPVDAYLFTGITPYHYALQSVEPTVLWDYLPRSVTSLLCALLKANMYGYDIHRISMDSYDEELLRLAYAEIGLSGKGITILAEKYQPTIPNYVEKLIHFHCENFQNGRARFCLTGIQAVHDAITAAKFPVAKVFAASEIILQRLQNLYIQHQDKVSEKDRIAVLSVEFIFSKERSIYGNNDLQFFRYKTKAMDEVYAFAQCIGAAVEVDDNERCRIYTRELTIETETKNFSNLLLLRELQKLDEILYTAIGIGFGKSPADAKYHADIGKERARKTRRNCFFIVHSDHRVIGPIVDASRRNQKIVVDRGLNKVSEKTGIGLERLHQLERIIHLKGLETVTPNELASLCGLSMCTMNRLLAKLEKNGYIRIVGKQASAPLGRPSRLIQFLF